MKTDRKCDKFIGHLFPNVYNSDGKAIQFSLHCPNGEIYLINADQKISKLRKLLFSCVLVVGYLRPGDHEVLNLKKIERFDYGRSHFIKFDDDVLFHRFVA